MDMDYFGHEFEKSAEVFIVDGGKVEVLNFRTECWMKLFDLPFGSVLRCLQYAWHGAV